MSALLARRERDGLSLRELSDRSGIPLGTLSWWSWRLRQDAVDTAGGFVEVVAAEPRADRGALIRLGSDLEIEVPAETDVTWLRDLVSALRSC
ncbi:MAG: hypothetical protein AB7O97_10575 [Planctomycetota bacterium]